MATRKDQVQISIAFLTDESKEYAKLLNENKQFINDIQKARREGKDLTEVIRGMAKSGAEISKIPLDKLAPSQLTTRARQLKQVLDLIPKSTPEYAALDAEYKKINAELATMRPRVQQVAGAMAQARTQSSGFGNALTTVLGVFGGFSLSGIVSQLLSFVGKLFEIGTGLDALANKTRTVFGEAEVIVQGYAETNAKALGLSRKNYIDLATSAGDLLKPMGFTEEAVARLSAGITDQAGIQSEWTQGRVSAKDASEILTKALLGERDALNTLGIDIKDSLIQDEIKRKGLQDLTGESRRQAEALITLEQITKQSTSANEAFTKGTESDVRAKAQLSARIDEITQGLAKGLVPVFNSALRAIIPLVDQVVSFGKRVYEAWQRAETFRGVLFGITNVALELNKTVLRIVGSISEGLLALFSGDFTKAFDIVKKAIADFNFVSVGIEFKKAFSKGFESKSLDFSVVPPGSEKEVEKQGNQVGKAFATGFDAEFERLKKTGERNAASLAKAAKDALALRLQEVEAAFLKEEIVADRALFNKEINEGQHGKTILELKKKQYEDQLAAFRQFNQLESKAALDAQRKIQEIAAQLNRPGVAPLAPLGTVKPGQVTSQTSGLTQAGDVAAADDEIQITKEKIARVIDLEQNSELLRLEMKRNALNAQLDLLRQNGLTETQVFEDILGAKLKADEEYQAKRVENEKRTKELRDKINQEALGAAADFFGIYADLLSQDEKARKKNAGAIKAFQTAQVIVQGIAEVQKIWAHAADLGPIAGPVVGAIQTAVAVARAAIAVGKINSTKFAGGGFTGRGWGLPDSTGHRPVGVVHEREWVGPRWMVESPTLAPVFSVLESVRQRGFADGGYSTTPAPSVTGISIPGAGQDVMAAFSRMSADIRGLREDVRNWRTRLKADISYLDIEDAGSALNLVRDDASI